MPLISPVGTVCLSKGIFGGERYDEKQDTRQSVGLSFKADTDLTEFNKSIDDAIAKHFKGRKIPKDFDRGLRSGKDAVTSDGTRYAGIGETDQWVKFWRYDKKLGQENLADVVLENPTVKAKPIDIYDGALGKVAYRPYVRKKEDGVSFSLEAFQRCGAGVPAANAPVRASDVFGQVASEDDI